MDNLGTVYNNNQDRVKKEQKIQEELNEIEQHEQRLSELAFNSRIKLFDARAVFPFDIFPDRIVIDPNKVTFINNFFLSIVEFPVSIKNITNIEVHHGIFLASIRVEVKDYSLNPPWMKAFTHVDAKIIKRYVTALIRCSEEGIDLTGMEESELRAKLQEIGKIEENKVFDHS